MLPRTPFSSRALKTLLPLALLLVAACSSGSGSAAPGEACAEVSRRCPGVSIRTCTPELDCQSQCFLDSNCTETEAFWSCLRGCAPATATDSGTSQDTRVGSQNEDTGTATPPEDTGSSGGDDASHGGGRGCTHDDEYSCTCADGVVDDGKGCSPSTISGGAGCCSNGSSCTCEAVTCTSNSGGCTCFLSSYRSASETSSCDGPLCCVFDASSSSGFAACTCYTGGKPGGCAVLGGREVSSCTAAEVPCTYDGETKVSACE